MKKFFKNNFILLKWTIGILSIILMIIQINMYDYCDFYDFQHHGALYSIFFIFICIVQGLMLLPSRK